MALLKHIGKGILYIIGLPFFLIVLVGASLFGIFLLIFMFFKSIILFFTGRSLDDDLPEDIEVKKLKGEYVGPSTSEPEESVEEETNNPEPYVSSTTTNSNSIEEAVFGHPIYETPTQAEPVVEEPVQETPVEPEPVEEDPVASIDIDEPKPTNTVDETIGQYIPRNSGSRFIDEEEEEEDSGVTIIVGDDEE